MIPIFDKHARLFKLRLKLAFCLSARLKCCACYAGIEIRNEYFAHASREQGREQEDHRKLKCQMQTIRYCLPWVAPTRVWLRSRCLAPVYIVRGVLIPE